MYEDLIKRLRNVSMEFGQSDHVSVLLLEAEDAIEEQDRRILTLQHEMMAEAESHTALVERLNKQIERLAKNSQKVDNKFGEWIPVTERLPSENGFYLCLYNHKHPGGVAMDEGLSILQWFCGRWNLNEIYTVTHWMPIPEPPKEVNKHDSD